MIHLVIAICLEATFKLHLEKRPRDIRVGWGRRAWWPWYSRSVDVCRFGGMFEKPINKEGLRARRLFDATYPSLEEKYGPEEAKRRREMVW